MPAQKSRCTKRPQSRQAHALGTGTIEDGAQTAQSAPATQQIRRSLKLRHGHCGLTPATMGDTKLYRRKQTFMHRSRTGARRSAAVPAAGCTFAVVARERHDLRGCENLISSSGRHLDRWRRQNYSQLSRSARVNRLYHLRIRQLPVRLQQYRLVAPALRHPPQGLSQRGPRNLLMIDF